MRDGNRLDRSLWAPPFDAFGSAEIRSLRFRGRSHDALGFGPVDFRTIGNVLGEGQWAPRAAVDHSVLALVVKEAAPSVGKL